MAADAMLPPTKTAGSRTVQLRLWPGTALVSFLWLAQGFAAMQDFSLPVYLFGRVITPIVVLIGLIAWWLAASRLPRLDRWLVVGTLTGTTLLTVLVNYANFPGMGLVVYAAPATATSWVLWLLVAARLPWPARRVGLLTAIVGVGVVVALLRIEGMDGSFKAKFSWRWTPTAEDRLLAKLRTAEPRSGPAHAEALREQPGDWPAFRGAKRDGRLSGVRIETDWRKSPPRELWRHGIGPGWSSMTIIGDCLFTQEQRGEDECVVCYRTADGAEVWSHRDTARFTELIAGPGPRATPTYDRGRLYTFGANGRLNCLRATDGAVVWTRDVAVDSGAKVPPWGFASSPLVTRGLAIVYVGAPDGKSVLAYRSDTGEPAWSAGEGTHGYCSPQLFSIDGVQQVLVNSNAGMSSFVPDSGEVLWHHSWPTGDKARIIQPVLVGQRDLLIGAGLGVGTRRVRVGRESGTWETQEQWTTKVIKPYFNDLVIVGDHLYGFDGSSLVCVALDDAQRKWRAGGYGNGQVLLLVEQDLLLVLSEQGEVALVAARPDRHEELARFTAIEGKTWNHPVIAHGKLFVRNGEEIACFQLELPGAAQEGRRQEVGGRRQEAGGRRQEVGGRRQEAGGRRQETECWR